MKIEKTRFGDLEIDPATILSLPQGLLGFESQTRFVLIDSDEVAPMRWLQAVDEPGLAFLVVEPALFFPDYRAALSADDREHLGLAEGEAPVLASLVVIPEDPSQMTVNLVGPLAFNVEKRLGKQVVQVKTPYSAKQRLFPDTPKQQAPALV